MHEAHIDAFIEKMNAANLQSHMEYIDGDAENGPRHNVPPYEPATRKDFVIEPKGRIGTLYDYQVTHYLCDTDGYEFWLTGFYNGGSLEMVVSLTSDGVAYWTSGKLQHDEAQGD